MQSNSVFRRTALFALFCIRIITFEACEHSKPFEYSKKFREHNYDRNKYVNKNKEAKSNNSSKVRGNASRKIRTLCLLIVFDDSDGSNPVVG